MSDDNVVELKARAERLKCPGAGRVGDNAQALIFYFNRRPTDDEFRYLHDVLRRAAGCAPKAEGRS